MFQQLVPLLRQRSVLFTVTLPAFSGPELSTTDMDEESELLAEISEAKHNDDDADEAA